MKLGVVFPQTEIGADPGAVRDYAQATETLGYNHLLAYDHVLGANAASRPGWHDMRGTGRTMYNHTDMFYEPFALFSYLAGVTQRLELMTGIIILPQRQTVLVAKQAATLDVLSGSRLRLGIGIGWNPVEYEALDMNFHNRGRRSEEQIEVLRALWTQELVTYKGRWHTITDAGLNPMPVQRPIPIWLGGREDRVLQRIARLGDGWLPTFRPDDAGQSFVEKMRAYAKEAGRDPSSIGIESRVTIANRSPEAWRAEVVAWQALGATHVGVNTMNAGLSSPDAHIEALRRFWEAMAGIG
jgi:probable F420-dependent oxidoreductase